MEREKEQIRQLVQAQLNPGKYNRYGVVRVGAGLREQHFCRFVEHQPHRRGRGTKLYKSFYTR
jgi:hypothetical protein